MAGRVRVPVVAAVVAGLLAASISRSAVAATVVPVGGDAAGAGVLAQAMVADPSTIVSASFVAHPSGSGALAVGSTTAPISSGTTTIVVAVFSCPFAVTGGLNGPLRIGSEELTVSAAGLADKIARAQHRMHCDFAFFMGGTRENASELGELERLPGCAGVKVFMGSSTGSLLVEDDATSARLKVGVTWFPMSGR